MEEQLAFPGFEEVQVEMESISPEEALRISVAAREAFDEGLIDRSELNPLRDEYLAMRALGWGWRKALYIAWAKLPIKIRWPGTQQELAELMGLRSARTIRKWREKNPAIGLLISRAVAERMSERTMDILNQAFAVGMTEGYKGFNDRRLLLEIDGVYNPKQDIAVTTSVINADEMAAKQRAAQLEASEWERERFSELSDGIGVVDENDDD